MILVIVCVFFDCNCDPCRSICLDDLHRSVLNSNKGTHLAVLCQASMRMVDR